VTFEKGATVKSVYTTRECERTTKNTKHFIFYQKMSKKRARSDEEPNAFGKWLVRKIYTYADVQEGEELRRTREELRIRTRAYENLRINVLSGDVAEPGRMCNRCGNVDVSLCYRPKCGVCHFSAVHCSQLPWCNEPIKCGSGKHLACAECPSYLHTSCTGTNEKKCTYEY
jgi:hypothetical protein